MRSVDPILPLKIQNSNTFNVFLPLLGAFVLCSHGPRAACSPARHGPGDTPAVVPITDTHHKRHLPAQYGRRSEPERVRSSRRRVHVAGGLSGRPCVVYGGLPHTRTHSSRRRAGYAVSASPVRVGGGCMPVDVAVWAMAPLRGGTAPTRRGRATGKKVQPNDKKQ